jgi:hypothetical protein
MESIFALLLFFVVLQLVWIEHEKYDPLKAYLFDGTQTIVNTLTKHKRKQSS